MNVAMIPARMGSQRLKKKNLREIQGIPIITHAIRKCKRAGVFDEIWVNSEHTDFRKIAGSEDVNFHQRPEELGNNSATSEQFVYEFLTKHTCDYIFQVHSIAPLLTDVQIRSFVNYMTRSNYDVLFSVVLEQIECALDSMPVNFSFDKKTNSQELSPIQKISWSITGWKSKPFVAAYEEGKCATYNGHVGFYPIDRLAGHIIKQEEDLKIAEALFPLRENNEI